jgi:two-component system, NarL family, invasion response regulator UvrY
VTSANPRFRVLLVDDHPMVREGARRTLETTLDLEIAGEASSVAEALTNLDGIHVVVLDLSLQTSSGLDAIPLIQRVSPTTRILVFTMMAAELFAVQSFRAGADGFLTKGCAPHTLIEAIRQVAAGRRYITPDVADLLADHLAHPQQMSPREVEVLRMLAQGMRVGDVAKHLHLSIKTVSTHKANLQRKLGVDSLAGLVRYALDNGIVPN